MKMLTTVTLLISLSLVSIFPETKNSIATTISKTESLPQNGLNVKGLNYGYLFDAIYSGRFIDMPLNSDSPIFASLYRSYLNNYSNKCGAYLPSTKVEITEKKCAQESVTTNGYGVEVSRTCTRYVDVRTGYFTTPENNNILYKLRNVQAKDGLRNVFKIVTDRNAIGSLTDDARTIQLLNEDLPKLLTINNCQSKAIQRFEKNLIRFALNKQPILLDGTVKEAKALSSNQNFDKLANDLVYDHSRSWAVNRFVGNSVNGTKVYIDNSGNPEELRAAYTFDGWRGRTRGTVRITFSNGIPDCIYFYDYPNTCRTANRRIVASYLEGNYSK